MSKPGAIPNADDLQKLMERFHRANWIAGVSMVSPEPFSMDFTIHGRWRMANLFKVFDELTPENFPDQSDLRATEAGQAIAELFIEAMNELQPPLLSAGEKETLLGLTMSFAKHQGWLKPYDNL